MMPWQGGFKSPMGGFDKQASGRPKSVGKPMFLRTNESESGFKPTFDVESDVMQQTHQKYLSKQELPPALAPMRFKLPNVMEQGRRRNISKGFGRRAAGKVN